MWSTTPSSIRKLSITSHDDDVDSIVSGDRDKLVSVHFKSEQDENSEKAGESFQQKVARIRKVSPHSHLPGWKIDGLICKSNDDLRQEVNFEIIFKCSDSFFDLLLLLFHTFRCL